jgi:formylglycine-generating enzyme required for sulfatase activity
MLGNVAEWVEDCYVKNYESALKDGSAITTGDCSLRVVRGGSWSFNPRDLRAPNRLVDSPGSRNNNIGFRVARTVAP